MEDSVKAFEAICNKLIEQNITLQTQLHEAYEANLNLSRANMQTFMDFMKQMSGILQPIMGGGFMGGNTTGNFKSLLDEFNDSEKDK